MLVVLVHAFITSRLDYCNSLFYGLPNSQLAKLQKEQNTTARLVCGTPRWSHVMPLLYQLHWLPVHYRIEFNIILFDIRPFIALPQIILLICCTLKVIPVILYVPITGYF